MQTHFSPEQLSDPLTARSNKILRTCVHCGFCTATCPTYQVLGDELDSPRGRIYLIKEMLESGRPADEKTVKHIDRCLGCLSCMTTCPSGVHYGHLLEHAREHIEETYRRPVADRFLRWVLKFVLPHPGRFRLALMGARIARPFKGLMPDRRLRAMLDMAPRSIPPVSRNDDGQTFPAQGTRRARVALMVGCAQRALNTDINDATIRLLQRAGVEVVIPQDFGCCGALTLHMGQEADGKARARDSIRRLLAAEEGGALDAVIINTSGCGTTIKDYGHLFKGDPMEADARRVAGLARDVTEFLVGLGLPARAGTPLQPAPRGLGPAGGGLRRVGLGHVVGHARVWLRPQNAEHLGAQLGADAGGLHLVCRLGVGAAGAPGPGGGRRKAVEPAAGGALAPRGHLLGVGPGEPDGA